MDNKIKFMTIPEMSLALDRLTRFKYPETKLKRVYLETICAHSIKPAYKKNDLENITNKELKTLFEKIWNESIIHNFGGISKDNALNKTFAAEEKKCYVLTKEQIDLYPMQADFKTLTDNLKKIPNNFLNYKTPTKIVLTEGVTEEILLPEFSKLTEHNWIDENIKIVATGGKNQVIKQYKIYRNQIKIPIYILLDNDAKPVYDEIKQFMRKIDFIHLIEKGEIEDIIPINLFKNAINHEFKLQSKISIKDFDPNLSMVKNLYEIYKNNGFGEFKKAKMAQLIKDLITSKTVLSSELHNIFNEIGGI